MRCRSVSMSTSAATAANTTWPSATATDSPLKTVGSVGKRNTGTRVRFWPDPKYFDTPKFNLRAIKHMLRAKAVLCPGLRVTLFDEASGERAEWYYEDGLRDYLRGLLADRECCRPNCSSAS
jgi:topoisomerase-4 subunit B